MMSGLVGVCLFLGRGCSVKLSMCSGFVGCCLARLPLFRAGGAPSGASVCCSGLVGCCLVGLIFYGVVVVLCHAPLPEFRGSFVVICHASLLVFRA